MLKSAVTLINSRSLNKLSRHFDPRGRSRLIYLRCSARRPFHHVGLESGRLAVRGSIPHLGDEAAGGDTLPEERKKAVLLSNLGFEGHRLCYDFTSQVDPATLQFQDMIRLYKHYADSTNSHVHRIISGDQRQQPEEYFQEFMTSLHRLAPACAFDAWHDKSLRDRILQGAASTRSRERLLYEGPSLALKKAEEIGRSVEQVHRELVQRFFLQVQMFLPFHKRHLVHPPQKNSLSFRLTFRLSLTLLKSLRTTVHKLPVYHQIMILLLLLLNKS
ncbi:hypothetical protein HPB49_005579 [Dermacentor silvarum]|uniref:Uncharacterized protein n=1 Tax=Dermacentor silvarum TaxID=543639 RepID=A0ACB8DVE6_DERSI|nr:hypothetical protein HPB49_005579 [Dermacentor silvarum]